MRCGPVLSSRVRLGFLNAVGHMPTTQKQALNVRVGQQVRGFFAEELESDPD